MNVARLRNLATSKHSFGAQHVREASRQSQMLLLFVSNVLQNSFAVKITNVVYILRTASQRVV